MRLLIFLSFLSYYSTTAHGVESSHLGPTMGGGRETFFHGQRKSLINWSNLGDNWLDINIWKRDFKVSEYHQDWDQYQRDRSLVEKVGTVLDCVGSCHKYRNVGFSSAGYGSSILEADELSTDEDSYLWILLLDGTLVRLSPESSISFKEFNVGVDRNFLHARINWGNILWLSRTGNTYAPVDRRETDTLFLPMAFHQANPKARDGDLNERKLERLNRLVLSNNKFVRNKATESFLVMPNGTLWGKGINAELVVIKERESFFKLRIGKQLGWNANGDDKVDLANQKVEFYYRGFANSKTFDPSQDTWYVVSPDGRVIREHRDSRKFSVGEYLTSNIISILTAREILLEQRSKFVFYFLRREVLAEIFGHRRWAAEEIDNRVKFLREYTRRLETSNIGSTGRFRKKMLERGEPPLDYVYDSRFYRRAINHHYKNDNVIHRTTPEGEILNSTKHPFWKRIKEAR